MAMAMAMAEPAEALAAQWAPAAKGDGSLNFNWVEIGAVSSQARHTERSAKERLLWVAACPGRCLFTARRSVPVYGCGRGAWIGTRSNPPSTTISSSIRPGH